jgi:hypothetical protein
MRSILLLSCAMLLASPGCNLPPLPRSPEAVAQTPRADSAAGEQSAQPPPTAAASLPERLERGAGGIRAALAAGYGRVWDSIEVVGSSGPVWILVFPIGLIGNLMGPRGGWR